MSNAKRKKKSQFLTHPEQTSLRIPITFVSEGKTLPSKITGAPNGHTYLVPYRMKEVMLKPFILNDVKPEYDTGIIELGREIIGKKQQKVLMIRTEDVQLATDATCYMYTNLFQWSMKEILRDYIKLEIMLRRLLPLIPLPEIKKMIDIKCQKRREIMFMNYLGISKIDNTMRSIWHEEICLLASWSINALNVLLKIEENPETVRVNSRRRQPIVDVTQLEDKVKKATSKYTRLKRIVNKMNSALAASFEDEEADMMLLLAGTEIYNGKALEAAQELENAVAEKKRLVGDFMSESETVVEPEDAAESDVVVDAKVVDNPPNAEKWNYVVYPKPIDDSLSTIDELATFEADTVFESFSTSNIPDEFYEYENDGMYYELRCIPVEIITPSF